VRTRLLEVDASMGRDSHQAAEQLQKLLFDARFKQG
jgi:hypothetical protein